MPAPGAEVVLIEFIGDAKSGVAAADEQVAANERVAASAKSASEASIAGSKKASQAMHSHAMSTSAAMATVGRTMTKWVTLPVLGVGAAATKMSLDFSKAMLLIETHTDTSRKMVDRYRKSIIAMSASGRYTQGPKELAEAMYHVASDGYKGAKALDVLRQSAHLATLGQSNLAETTYALVSAEKTGIKGTKNLHEAIGLLNGIVGAGDMKMQDLVGAMSTGVLPAAKSVGLSLKDVGAALDVMTQRGVPAQQAAYRLAMNFSMLSPYSKKAKEAFEALGLGQYELVRQIHGPTGLLNALQVLQQHLARFNKYEQRTFIQEIFGGGRSSRAMLTLLQNMKGLEQSYGSINRLAGETDKNLAAALKSPANVWAKEWAKLQAALVEVGNELVPVVIPAMKEIAGDVTSVAHTFAGLPHGVQSWIIKLGLAAAALGPIIGLLAKAVKLTEALGVLNAGGAAAGAAGAAGGAAAGGEVAAGEAAAGTGFGAMIGRYGKKLGKGLAGAVAGYFVAELGVEIGKQAGMGDPTEGQGIWKSLTHGFNTSPQKGKRTEEEGNRLVQGLNPKISQEQLDKLRHAFRNTMIDLSTDAIAGMGQINKDLRVGLTLAAKQFRGHEWRMHAAKAMHEAVIAIEVGMADGTISAKKGQQEINRLLARIHVIRGNDPFGLADATAKSFKQQGAITSQGVKAWANKLDDMPKAAREKTIDATMKMLRAWADGHPKIEKQIEGLTAFEIRKFGATNQQLREGVKKGATGPVADAFREAAEGVGGALQNIGTNTSRMLAALGLHSKIQFDALVFGPSQMPQLRGKRAAEAHHHPRFRAGGGTVRVPGQGLQDTVPLYANGALSAVVAPGEDLAVINRHQRPLLDHAVAAAFPGTKGLDDFFARHNKPHFMAQGGMASVRVSGPGATAKVGHGALGKVVEAAQRYIARHTPQGGPSGAGGPVPAGQLRAWLTEALRDTGHYSPGNLSALFGRAMQESGGNPRAINLWDSNAAAGHPSKGLLQTIDSTFNAYKMRGHGNIWNPVDNAIAAIRYMFARYGHIVGPGAGGYAKGGIVPMLAGGGFLRSGKWRNDLLTTMLRSGHPTWGEVRSWDDLPDRVRFGNNSRLTLRRLRRGLDRGYKVNDDLTISHPPATIEAGSPRGQSPVRARFGALLRFARGGNVVLEPGVNMHAGKEPQILGDLKALSQKLGQAVYVISGYRSPAHSVEVGGFANDPHTRGEAADIGIGSASRSSMSKVTEAMLHSVNLDRPFYPGSASEVNHVQLWQGGGAAAKHTIKKVLKGAYTTHRAGQTSAGGGTYGETAHAHFKVFTDKLSFGSVPTDLRVARKELRQRVKQLSEYRAAYRQVKDPATKQAIATNVRLLENRVAALRKAIVRLIAKRRRDRKVAKIEARGTFPGIEERIAAIEDTYEKATERAQQLVELEPEEGAGFVGDFSAVLTSYIEQQEAPAWGNVLNPTLAGWRNTLLTGESEATGRIASLEAQVAHIESLRGQGQGKNRNKAWNRAKYKLPALRKAIATAKESYDPTTGRGSFADRLKDVQGGIGPREILGSLPTEPVAGKFGGLVWDAQMDLHDLDIKIRQAKESSAAGSENTGLTEALKRLAEQAQKERALAESQYGPLAQFLHAMPPLIGAFKSGGPIPGPANQAYTAIVHGGEYVVPAGGSGSPGHTHFHLHGDIAALLDVAAPGLVKTVDQQLGTHYRHIAYGPGGRK